MCNQWFLILLICTCNWDSLLVKLLSNQFKTSHPPCQGLEGFESFVSSLTSVSNSLAWDWVPVETRRLLPSNQHHQEQDPCPTHGPPIVGSGTRWWMSGMSSGDQMNSGEKARSWQAAVVKERNHNNTSDGRRCLLPSSPWLHIRNSSAGAALTPCTFFKRTNKTRHKFQLRKEDKFLLLKADPITTEH